MRLRGRWVGKRGVQRVGGQAVVRCFRTAGTAVAEAEANLPISKERHMRKALRTWVDLHSMPETHPLARLVRRREIQEVRVAHAEDRRGCPRCVFEGARSNSTLHLSSRHARLDTIECADDGVQVAVQAQQMHGVRVAAAHSATPIRTLVKRPNSQSDNRTRLLLTV